MPHAARFVLAVALIAGCGPSTPPLETPASADGPGAAERLADLDWLLATVARRAASDAGLAADARRAHYRDRAAAATTRAGWIAVLEDVLGELHDHHASLGTNTPASPRLVPSGADLWAEMEGDVARITAVRPGGAAERAGVRAGVTGRTIAGEPAAQAVARRRPAVRGQDDPEAASWALRVLLAGQHDRPRRLTVCQGAAACVDLTLGAPDAPPTDGLVGARLDGDLGILRLHNSLGEDATVAAFDAALATLASAKALVLDLRDTPSGGSSEVAEPILGRFVAVAAGYQLVEVHGRDARPWPKQVSPCAPHEARPLVVLVDRWTGSMGEGMAIGLDGLGRATVVGSAMAQLRGGVDSFELPRTHIPVRFPIERLLHLDGTPRERWLPPIRVDAVGGEADDPFLARARELLR